MTENSVTLSQPERNSERPPIFRIENSANPPKQMTLEQVKNDRGLHYDRIHKWLDTTFLSGDALKDVQTQLPKLDGESEPAYKARVLGEINNRICNISEADTDWVLKKINAGAHPNLRNL